MTRKKLRLRRPSAAMVVACLALFVALGGVSVAALKLKPNSVKTKNVKNGAITESKIANGAVTETKIANGAITKAKLGSGVAGAKNAVAAGTATNDGLNGATSSVGLGANVCALFTLNAPGAQVGDAVAITPHLVLATGIATVSYDGNAVPSDGKLQVRVCSASVPYTVNTNDLSVAWVAFR